MHKLKPTKIPGSSIQAVINVYKKDVDRTLIRENLKLTVEERLLNLQNLVQFTDEFREAGKKVRQSAALKGIHR